MLKRQARGGFWLGLLLVLGCSDHEPEPATTANVSTFTDPDSELPQQLSQLGLYPELPPSSLELSAPFVAYEPAYPLWSDGGRKYRGILLPQGASIDASSRDDWQFPTGTLLIKTFAFRTPASPERELPVETRILRLRDAGWELSDYEWTDDASEATLLDLKRARLRDVLDESDQLVSHAIPSRLDCRQCHESSQSEVLGVNELELAASGSLTDLRPVLDPPPEEPLAALPAHGPLTTRVLSYFVGNCVHCHNGSNGAASSFDLRPAVALKNVVGQPTASSATADGLRVAPGDPEQSLLYLAVQGSGGSEVKDMPPLGVALRDTDAVQALADWIEALGEEDDP